jgi:magnesium transporter
VFRSIVLKGDTIDLRDGAANVAAPAEGETRWIDLAEFNDAELEVLHQRFGFHPLAIEDCTVLNHRAKVDEYGNYLFMVLHSIDADAKGLTFATEQLNAFLGERYLVTVHQKPIKQVETVWKRAAHDNKASFAEGVDFLLYLIADALADDAFPLIDELADQLEAIEAEILDRVDQSQLVRLLALRRVFITIRKTLSPERDVLAMLVRRGDPRISEKTGFYFRDVYDHLVRAYEQIDVERDLLGNAMEAYISMMENRTNNIMKQLTIFASIFLPLTFLTGFFGQNFDAMPYKSMPLYHLMLIISGAVPIGMLYWFWRKNWL